MSNDSDTTEYDNNNNEDDNDDDNDDNNNNNNHHNYDYIDYDYYCQYYHRYATTMSTCVSVRLHTSCSTERLQRRCAF